MPSHFLYCCIGAFDFFLANICFQLLDCFVIPVLMLLSWWVLKTRYTLVHYVAVCICLLGVGAMVGADLLAGRDLGSCKNSRYLLVYHSVVFDSPLPKLIHQNVKAHVHVCVG